MMLKVAGLLWWTVIWPLSRLRSPLGPLTGACDGWRRTPARPLCGSTHSPLRTNRLTDPLVTSYQPRVTGH
ncbi:hypothetical protein BC834DRAFT_900721 [Gloeopeniophorella convolvens]|nr:hypothetical protein BC834DRAFT_900721 [Gloeopeniophorella convolvens]